MTSLPQAKTITELTQDGWKPLDLWWDTPMDERPIGGPAIFTNGTGMIVQVGSDGLIAHMVAQDSIPEDAPLPMFGTTTRNGVIGYMCKINFECELGGTRTSISSTAEGAYCAGSCGVVEVEVIGRRIIIPEDWSADEMTDEQAAAKREADMAILKAIDAGT